MWKDCLKRFVLPRFAASVVRRVLLVTLALTLAALLMPATARAGCGDYVTRGGSALTHPDNHSPAQGAKAIASDRATNIPCVPCRGPHCSRGTPPPSAPVASARVIVQEWACMATLHFMPTVCPAFSPQDEPEYISCNFLSSIFHPPRVDSPRTKV
jgi:hypothetical protein